MFVNVSNGVLWVCCPGIWQSGCPMATPLPMSGRWTSSASATCRAAEPSCDTEWWKLCVSRDPLLQLYTVCLVLCLIKTVPSCGSRDFSACPFWQNNSPYSSAEDRRMIHPSGSDKISQQFFRKKKKILSCFTLPPLCFCQETLSEGWCTSETLTH